MDISVVIPLYNEEESLGELFGWIKTVMDKHKFSFEVIMIDDGSSDTSWKVIEKLAKENPDQVKGIKFRRNYGKSAALYSGFKSAQGDVVITMDADLQDSPEEIPDLYRMIKEEKYDLVSGWKQRRYDPIAKTLPSKLFNWTARKVTGIQLNDFNCGLKAYKLKVVKSIEVYGEMHRYIPVLAKWAGFKKIGEKVVQHQARKYGVTKFGLERFLNGFLDLMSIMFMAKFGKRPMHLFGSMGSVMFLMGFLITIWLGVQKLYYLTIIHETKALIAENPLFYIALAVMVMGTQLFLAGFLGELISRNAIERNHYIIDKTV